MSAGAVWQFIQSTDDEHVDKGVHGLGMSRGGQHTTPCAEGVGRTFEADAIQALIKGDGAFLHETTDDVVGDGVHDQLPPHHGGALAAHHGGSLTGLEVVEIHFDAPTPLVETDQSFHRPEHRIEQRGGNHQFVVTKPFALGSHSDLAYDNARGQAVPAAGAHHCADLPGFAHRDKAVIYSELAPPAPINLRRVFGPHDEINSAAREKGKVQIGPEAAIGDQDVAFAHPSTQEGEKPRFMPGPRAMRRPEQSA